MRFMPDRKRFYIGVNIEPANIFENFELEEHICVPTQRTLIYFIL